MLNHRLVTLMNDNNIYKPNQIAFREGNRTADHIFVIQTLIDKYIRNRVGTNKNSKHLYICFIDLRKAFDTIWRDALLYKRLEIEKILHEYLEEDDELMSEIKKIKFMVDPNKKVTNVIEENNILRNDLEEAYLEIERLRT